MSESVRRVGRYTEPEVRTCVEPGGEDVKEYTVADEGALGMWRVRRTGGIDGPDEIDESLSERSARPALVQLVIGRASVKASSARSREPAAIRTARRREVIVWNEIFVRTIKA